MGIDTYFRVWRRFNKKTGSAEEIAALREQYKLRNAAEDWSSEKENHAAEHEKDMPILLEQGFKADRNAGCAEDKDPRAAWGTEHPKHPRMRLPVLQAWIERRADCPRH